jgi:hypothetical protein
MARFRKGAEEIIHDELITDMHPCFRYRGPSRFVDHSRASTGGYHGRNFDWDLGLAAVSRTDFNEETIQLVKRLLDWLFSN